MFKKLFNWIKSLFGIKEKGLSKYYIKLLVDLENYPFYKWEKVPSAMTIFDTDVFGINELKYRICVSHPSERAWIEHYCGFLTDKEKRNLYHKILQQVITEAKKRSKKQLEIDRKKLEEILFS